MLTIILWIATLLAGGVTDKSADQQNPNADSTIGNPAPTCGCPGK
jgi:hypothetical protein